MESGDASQSAFEEAQYVKYELPSHELCGKA